MCQLFAIGVIVAIAIAGHGCGGDYRDTRPADSQRNKRLTEAELISAAMFVYADRHDNTLPPSLDALKPDYLGQPVDTSFLIFHYPGGTLKPRDGRVIASEKQYDSAHQIHLHLWPSRSGAAP